MSSSKILGVLGGMGPLASAELMSSLYRFSSFEREQEAPACILYSDPDIPDRTEAILSGSIEPLVGRLAEGVEALLKMGAHRVVIACVTAHHVLPNLPEELRGKIVSMLDLVIDELLADPRRHLLLATSGTRSARIFESHPRWSLVESYICFPDEEEQHRLHGWIYRIKKNEPLGQCREWLVALAQRHEAAGLIFGCTELHLLHREWGGDGPDLRLVDPLLIVARDLPRLLPELLHRPSEVDLS